MINKAINIVVDNTDPTNPIFIEIENDDGASIGIGTWTHPPNDEYSVLRITADDILKVDK